MEVSNLVWTVICVYAAIGLLTVVFFKCILLAALASWYWDPPPWPAALLGGRLRAILLEVISCMLPPGARCVELASAHVGTHVVLLLALFGIPDALRAGGPMTAQQIADQLQLHAPYLERVLRASAHLGILRRRCRRTRSSSGGGGKGTEQYSYSLNAVSAVLCSAHPGSVRNLLVHWADVFPAWHHLRDALKDGKVPFSVYRSTTSYWTHLADNPPENERFDKAMGDVSQMDLTPFIDYPHWSEFRRVLDVGGGLGGMLLEVLTRFPAQHQRGVVLDEPDTIKRAEKMWQQEHPELLAQVEFVAGSFFNAKDIPVANSSGDAYVLRNILHDWDDEHCETLLRNLRAAMGNHPAKLLIVEATSVEDKNKSTLLIRDFFDLHMLAAFGEARERNEDEFRVLLTAAGFELIRIWPTRGALLVVEARPRQ